MNDPCNLLSCPCHVFVLPEPQHPPARGLECVRGVSVPLDVPLDLVTPPLGIRLRPGPVNWATVPKASIYEHGNSRARECEVGTSTRAWQRPVDSKTQSETMSGGPKGELARSVATRRRLHPTPDIR